MVNSRSSAVGSPSERCRGMCGHVGRGAPRVHPGRPFLDTHREVLAAMDFFTVPTLTFGFLYVLLIIQHDRRKVRLVNVTAHPTSAWVSRQLRAAFPFADAFRYLVMDRDAIFSAEVCRVLRHLYVQPVRTSFQSPWQNGVAERWVGTCRRELLDHVIVLSEAHLRRLLREFLEYYHNDRTHLSLGKDPPYGQAVGPSSSTTASVTSVPRIGGLHHRYEWNEAA